MLYVAWKRGLPRKFARFFLFRLIKKRSFNLLCVLGSLLLASALIVVITIIIIFLLLLFLIIISNNIRFINMSNGSIGSFSLRNILFSGFLLLSVGSQLCFWFLITIMIIMITVTDSLSVLSYLYYYRMSRGDPWPSTWRHSSLESTNHHVRGLRKYVFLWFGREWPICCFHFSGAIKITGKFKIGHVWCSCWTGQNHWLELLVS